MSVSQKMKLNEAGVTLIDCDHKTPAAQTSGYPYIGIPQLKNGHIRLDGARLISEEDFVLWTKKAKPKHNDVILSRRCNPGESAYVPEGLEIALGQNLVLLRSDGSVIYPPFLRWLVQGNEWWEQVNKFLNVGAVFDSLKCKDIPNFNLTIPSLKEQKRITDILSSLDNKIELNNKVNQTLESITQAIFKSWFIDFDPVRAKIAAKQNGEDPELAAMCAISGKSQEELQQMPEEDLTELRATVALFPDELVESELGEVPKGWSVSKVDDILKRIKIKKRFKKNDVNEFGQTFVLEQGSNIILGFHDNEGSISASKEEPAFIFGDHTCITRLMLSNFDVSENVIAVKGKERNSYWTYYAIKDLQKFQEYRRHWMELTSKQVVVADVRLTDYFAKKVKILHEDIEYSLRENLVLMNLRNTLLPKLLSGEISVSSFQEDTND